MRGGGYHAAYDPTFAGRNGVAIPTRVRRSQCAPGHPPMTDFPVARELRAFADEGPVCRGRPRRCALTIASVYVPKGGLPAHLQIPGGCAKHRQGRGIRPEVALCARADPAPGAVSARSGPARPGVPRHGRLQTSGNTELDAGPPGGGRKARAFCPKNVRGWMAQTARGLQTSSAASGRERPVYGGGGSVGHYAADTGWRSTTTSRRPASRAARPGRAWVTARWTVCGSAIAPVTVDYDVAQLR